MSPQSQRQDVHRRLYRIRCGNESVYPLRRRVSDQEAPDPSLDLSGTDGHADSVEAIGEEGRPIVPQGPDWSPARSAAHHGQSSLHAAGLLSSMIRPWEMPCTRFNPCGASPGSSLTVCRTKPAFLSFVRSWNIMALARRCSKPVSELRWSIYFDTSHKFMAIGKSTIAAWQKTPPNCTCWLRSATW